MSKIKLARDYEEIGDIVREDLIDSYFCIIRVDGWGSGMLKHLRKVIHYYSDNKQWKEFKEMEKLGGEFSE